MYLAIRTDNPEAEIYLLNKLKTTDKIIWHADRELSQTLLKQIYKLLNKNKLKLNDITGIICFKGPGSFTGLRIGITVGNALADSLGIAIVGSDQRNWLNSGVQMLANGTNHHIVIPEYGAEPNITKPRH